MDTLSSASSGSSGKAGRLATDVITSIFRNVEVTQVLQRIAVAGVVPFIAKSLWKLSHTVIEISDVEQTRWLQFWLAAPQQRSALAYVRHVVMTTALTAGKRSGGRSARRYYDEDDDDDDGGGQEVGERFAPPKLLKVPAAGVTIWFFSGWYPVSVKQPKTTGMSGGAMINPYGEESTEKYQITVWFARDGFSVAKKMILEGRRLWQSKRSTKTEVLMYREGYSPARFKTLSRPSRPLRSVIVHGDTKQQLLDDCRKFLHSEKWYIGKGIPYRRGYLLYGEPGCGKTSLITALAGALQLPIVLLPLNSKKVSDQDLMDVLSGAPRDSIILIEDVDCALGPGGRRPGKVIKYNGKVFVDSTAAQQSSDSIAFGRHHGGVTLSGLLNAIDGVAAQEGRILFMTTNHRDHLDPALIRPGRVDVEYCLRKASKDGAGQLFDQFFGSEGLLQDEVTVEALMKDQGKAKFNKAQLDAYREAFVGEVEDHVHSFAKLQGVLMETLEDPSFAADVMRAKVSEAQLEKIDTVAEEDGVEEGLAWHRFTCDECGESPIMGCLYHNAMIQNYDLCTSCYNKKIRPTHSFWLYRNPNNRKDRKLLPPQSEATRTKNEEDTATKVEEQDGQYEDQKEDKASSTADEKVAILQEPGQDVSSKKNEAMETRVFKNGEQNEDRTENTSASSVTQEDEDFGERMSSDEETSVQEKDGHPSSATPHGQM